MPAEKTEAIVLRVIAFSETSVIATLFTRHFGKISGLAKGARRPKSPFEAALDVLSICRIVFLRKSSDGLDLLTEAKLQRRFRGAEKDLARAYAGYYVVELLSAMTDERDPHPNLYDCAESTIIRLDEGRSLAEDVMRFEMRLLAELGHSPSLTKCAGCGQTVESSKRAAFGMLGGGVLCTRCRSGQRSVVSIDWSTLRALRQLAGASAAGSPLPKATKMGEIRGVLDQYISHLLGYRPKLQAYLKQL